jgi:hypothetical protein
MRNRPVLAVFFAALLPMLLGAVWYAPFLFGRAWERAHGYDAADLAALQADMVRNYLVAFVSSLVMALVLRFLLYRLAAADALAAMRLAALCWLGFAATIGLPSVLFALRPLSLWLIDAGFQLVYMGLMALVLRPRLASET